MQHAVQLQRIAGRAAASLALKRSASAPGSHGAVRAQTVTAHRLGHACDEARGTRRRCVSGEGDPLDARYRLVIEQAELDGDPPHGPTSTATFTPSLPIRLTPSSSGSCPARGEPHARSANSAAIQCRAYSLAGPCQDTSAAMPLRLDSASRPRGLPVEHAAVRADRSRSAASAVTGANCTPVATPAAERHRIGVDHRVGQAAHPRHHRHRAVAERVELREPAWFEA